MARRWLATFAAAGAAIVPVIVLGWLQRWQVAWIPKPGWADAGRLVIMLAGGSAASAVPLGVLGLVGVVRGGPGAPGRRAGMGAPAGRGGRELAWLAGPWLTVPPALLLAASEVKPSYSGRYLAFCLPAVALLAGAGLAALGRMVRAGALVLLVGMVLPAQLAARVPGAGMRAAAQIVAAREHPGDAVIYPGGGIPPWYLAYPGGLGRLRDIGLAESAPVAGRLYGTSVPVPVLKLRQRGVSRIWVLQIGASWQPPDSYLAPGFRIVGSWRLDPGPVRLELYTRPGPGPAPGR